MNVKLYTSQEPGHNITKRRKPLAAYLPGGMYSGIVKMTGWKDFIWALTWDDREKNRQEIEGLLNLYRQVITLQGLENEDIIKKESIWQLSVPEENILYFAPEHQEQSGEPVRKYRQLGQVFHDEAECRKFSIPQVLIKTPILKSWVHGVTSEITAFPKKMFLEGIKISPHWQRRFGQ